MALAAGALLGAGAALAGDGDSEGRRFSYKDWDLACDNTRACRAVGYQAEAQTVPRPCSTCWAPIFSPISLLITRAAGPNTPVAMTLGVDSADNANLPSSPCRLRVGRVDLRGLKRERDSLEIKLTPVQARAVMVEILNDHEPLVWLGAGAKGNPYGRLSLAGLNAVLLKMDEWQGRIGTPGALIRRGNKPESSVLPPLPMPVVKVAAPVATRPTDVDLAERIFPAIDFAELLETGNCYFFDEEHPEKYFDAKSFRVHRLTNRRVLLTSSCQADRHPMLGERSVYWIANDRPPYDPQPIKAYGEFSEKDMSISGSGGSRISEPPCLTYSYWHFNGQKFVLTGSSSNDYPCRVFGGLPLETYVTRVIPAKSAAPKFQKP